MKGCLGHRKKRNLIRCSQHVYILYGFNRHFLMWERYKNVGNKASPGFQDSVGFKKAGSLPSILLWLSMQHQFLSFLRCWKYLQGTPNHRKVDSQKAEKSIATTFGHNCAGMSLYIYKYFSQFHMANMCFTQPEFLYFKSDQ